MVVSLSERERRLQVRRRCGEACARAFGGVGEVEGRAVATHHPIRPTTTAHTPVHDAKGELDKAYKTIQHSIAR